MEKLHKEKYLKYKQKYMDLKQKLQKGGEGENKIVLLDGREGEISDELFDDIASWILFSMREMMGYSEVRQNIILGWLDEYKIANVVRTVTTINPQRKNNKEVKDLCGTILKDTNLANNIYVFTGTNLADPRSNETHYNIFIVNKSAKTLMIIDPASKRKYNRRTRTYETVSGIYESYLANDTIIPIFNKEGYTCNFLQLTNSAQTITSDVFCQTWTLVILRSYLNNIEVPVVEIPKQQSDKNNILLTFYKYILERFPEYKKILNDGYVENIQNERTKLVSTDNERLQLVDASSTLIKYFTAEDVA